MSDFYNNQIEKIEGTNSSKKRMLKEFKELIEEEHGFDFNILDGKLEVDNIGGFSDGTYELEKQDIDIIDSSSKLYLMKLEFKMKRKGITYTKNTEITFHYTNGNEMIINYKGNFYRIPIGNKTIHIRKKIKTGTKFETIGNRKKIKIDDLRLILEFKTD